MPTRGGYGLGAKESESLRHLRGQIKSDARPFVVLREPNTRLPLSKPVRFRLIHDKTCSADALHSFG